MSRVESLPRGGAQEPRPPEIAPLQSESCSVPKSMLSVQAVSTELAVSAATVYRIVDQRLLPFYRIHGSLRIARTDLDAYLARCLVVPLHG